MVEHLGITGVRQNWREYNVSVIQKVEAGSITLLWLQAAIMPATTENDDTSLPYEFNLLSRVFRGLPLSSTPLPSSSTSFMPTPNQFKQEQLWSVRMAPKEDNSDKKKHRVKVKYVSAHDLSFGTVKAYLIKS
jgi:hypothetical protein